MLCLSCVVHGPIYCRCMGFYVNGFFCTYKVYEGWGLGHKFTPTDPIASKFHLGNTQ